MDVPFNRTDIWRLYIIFLFDCRESPNKSTLWISMYRYSILRRPAECTVYISSVVPVFLRIGLTLTGSKGNIIIKSILNIKLNLKLFYG